MLRDKYSVNILCKVLECSKSGYYDWIKLGRPENKAFNESTNELVELIFKDGNNLTVQDMAKIMTKKADVNVHTRAYDYIMELVARNPNKFVANEYGNYQGEVWGKIEADNIYIIKSVFDREMSLQGYNSTAFLAWAKRHNVTFTDSGKRTKKARITGSSTNCACIRKNLSEDMIQETNQKKKKQLKIPLGLSCLLLTMAVKTKLLIR